MTAQILEFSPKGSAWLVYHRRWAGGGCTTNWAFVFNYHKGLTAFEAWQEAKLEGNPPFCESITTLLTPYPSVDTKRLKSKALRAIKRLANP